MAPAAGPGPTAVDGSAHTDLGNLRPWSCHPGPRHTLLSRAQAFGSTSQLRSRDQFLTHRLAGIFITSAHEVLIIVLISAQYV